LIDARIAGVKLPTTPTMKPPDSTGDSLDETVKIEPQSSDRKEGKKEEEGCCS